ncbi:MAG: hypothetical protein ACYDCQ_06750 [Dehalococcoidia bacterium]
MGDEEYADAAPLPDESAAPPPVMPQIISVASEAPPQQRPIAVDDTLRTTITVAALVIFGGTLLFAELEALTGIGSWTSTKEFLQLALPAETALTGAVVGFYFGSRRQP